MTFPAYPEYKDSGVEWLGEVPAHWQIRPFFSQFSEREESNRGMVEDNLLSLSYGKIVNKNIRTLDGLLPESYETYQVVHPNDIVFRLTDLQNDKRSLRSAKVEEKGIITSAYLAVESKEIDATFSHYLFRAYDLLKVFYSMGGGLRQTMKFFDMKWLPVLFPPRHEQRAIASFLDHETARIDALIEEQQRLIELLKEKRQAVISHAVTKGLDPDVPMKDSGVEWLGEVPAHWGVTRLKYVTDLIVDCPHETPAYDPEGEYCVIRTADIEQGTLDPNEMYRLNDAEYQWRIRREELLVDDIVYGREGERWGHAALVPESDRYCLGQRMMQFRPASDVCPVFLMWQLNASHVYRQGETDIVGATSPHINVETIRNYRLTLPSYSEQLAIGEYIAKTSNTFDELIQMAQAGIYLLGERKAALVSAAVTGKIDVRDWQPPSSEAFPEISVGEGATA